MNMPAELRQQRDEVTNKIDWLNSELRRKGLSRFIRKEYNMDLCRYRGQLEGIDMCWRAWLHYENE